MRFEGLFHQRLGIAKPALVQQRAREFEFFGLLALFLLAELDFPLGLHEGVGQPGVGPDGGNGLTSEIDSLANVGALVRAIESKLPGNP